MYFFLKYTDEIVRISGNKNIVVKHLDLASLKSVRNFAQDIIATENRLDVLINNAGVNCTVHSKTEDDISLGLQVNHFGHFLLTNLLIGKIIHLFYINKFNFFCNIT